MKAEIAGVELDLPAQVTFFDFEHGPPVFHAPADDFESRSDPENGVSSWRVRTRCGETTYGEVQTRDEVVDVEGPRGTTIPARYALKFGRPCATCWPALRAQPALFSRRRSGPGRTRRDLQEAIL